MTKRMLSSRAWLSKASCVQCLEDLPVEHFRCVGICLRGPLRGRTPASQWGFEHLTPGERELVLTDGILMFRMIWLSDCCSCCGPAPFFGMEHLQDPESWACPEDFGLQVPDEGIASCWALDAIRDFAAEHELHFWHLDQGPLGHERRKPTTILSSVPPPPNCWSLAFFGVGGMGAGAQGHNNKQSVVRCRCSVVRDLSHPPGARELPEARSPRPCGFPQTRCAA